MSQPSQANPRRVDPRIWRACAGNSVQMPTLHSRVYYFPQGHVEQLCTSGVDNNTPTTTTTLLSPVASSRLKPLVPCLVIAVHFLADPITDEVFAKLTLQPVSEISSRSFGSLTVEHQHGGGGVVVSAGDNGDIIVPFSKTLTASDANNGGGFSVPRFCADSVFPPLNYEDEPPVQTLSVTDIHGFVWNFRHIYRGTPRRHLLTTGWSKFVNAKKLIAGDSVVFMRNNKGVMFVGVRRVGKYGHGSDSARWGGAGGGARTEAVRAALENAAEGLPFEVVYYPRSGWSDFVVRAEVVESSLNLIWSRGMRVKMSVETEDSSRMTWFQGKVESAAPQMGSWPGSPWRMLQISWDEPEVLQNAKRVSPWQVELVSSTPQLQPPFTPVKKFKYSQNSGFPMDGDDGVCFPMTGFNPSTMGQTNLSSMNYHSFSPAGMQGARQNSFSLFGLPDFISENTLQGLPDNNIYAFSNHTLPKSKTISNEINNHIACSQFDKLSPDSQTSVISYGMELLRNEGINNSTEAATEAATDSFQLFGKVIQIKKPREGDFESGDGIKGSTEDDTTKWSTEDDGSKGYYGNEDMENSLHLSSEKPYLQLIDRLDVPSQSAFTNGSGSNV
ncbi:hypothetical protein ACFE04_012496 [Oxalis oulophora]